MRLARCRILTIAVVGLCLAPDAARAQGPAPDFKAWWPQFLGPQRNGVAADKNLNFDWKKAPPKVLWKVPLGDGFSSFAVVGDRAYTMCKRGQRDVVVCLDTATGKEQWAYDAAPSYLDKQKQGAGPRATPTYFNGKLYCLLPMGELICLTAADGKLVWAADQFQDTGSANPAGGYFYWGAALSPLVEGDFVIVQPGGKKNTSVAAYHKDTGKLSWTAGDDPPGYGSPIAVTIGGQRQVIVSTGASVLGIDPAAGKVLWRYPFGNKFNATCATPVWADDLLFVSAAYGVGAAALEIAKKDGTWAVTEKWKNKRNLQTLFATAMVVDGHIYGCHGDLSAFTLKSLDLKTGAVQWDQRVEDRLSLLAVDGHLLCWSETGSLSAVELTPTGYRQKGELAGLLRAKSWAAPALADGRLYLRDESHALCLDLRRP